MGAVSDRIAAKRKARLGKPAVATQPHHAAKAVAALAPPPPADAKPADPAKVIFLDVMGTLNSHAFRMREHEDRAEPAKCAIVNAIVAATGARIVVSSSVRTNHGCRKGLVDAGLADAFHEDWRTPDVPDAYTLPRRRSREIQAWLDAHPGTTAYVVLDDDAAGIASEHRRNAVIADGAYGLHPFAQDAATEILARGPDDLD